MWPPLTRQQGKLSSLPGTRPARTQVAPSGIDMPPQVTTRAQGETASCIQHQHTPGLAPPLTQLKWGNSERQGHKGQPAKHAHCSSIAPSRVREAVSSYSQGKTIPAHSKNKSRLGSSNDARDAIFHITRKHSMARPQYGSFSNSSTTPIDTRPCPS